MPASTLTCREFTALILAYLEAELGQAERQLFGEHASACKRCRNYLGGYESTVNFVRLSYKNLESADTTTMPEALLCRILNAASKGTGQS